MTGQRLQRRGSISHDGAAALQMDDGGGGDSSPAGDGDGFGGRFERTESPQGYTGTFKGGSELDAPEAAVMSTMLSSRHGLKSHVSPRRIINAAAFVIGHMAATGNARRRKKEPTGGDPFEGLECAKTLEAGTWLCEMALVHEGVHETTVICHREVTILALDHHRLHQVRMGGRITADDEKGKWFLKYIRVWVETETYRTRLDRGLRSRILRHSLRHCIISALYQ